MTKTKKRISVQSAKAKGRRLQQWVAKKISEITGIPLEKDGEIESRPMGQSGTDIRLSGEALYHFPFSVECKSQETWSIPAWIRQAQENQIEGTDWLLVCKRNHEKPVVVMDAKTFFMIYKWITSIFHGVPIVETEKIILGELVRKVECQKD